MAAVQRRFKTKRTIQFVYTYWTWLNSCHSPVEAYGIQKRPSFVSVPVAKSPSCPPSPSNCSCLFFNGSSLSATGSASFVTPSRTLAHSYKKKIMESETFQGYSLSKLSHDAWLGVPKKLKEQPLHTMCNDEIACLARGYGKNCATATL